MRCDPLIVRADSPAWTLPTVVLMPLKETSWAPLTVIGPEIVNEGVVASETKEIGAVSVPERVRVNPSYPGATAPVIWTVWPGSTTSAASWTVQKGSACEPGPLSTQDCTRAT